MSSSKPHYLAKTPLPNGITFALETSTFKYGGGGDGKGGEHKQLSPDHAYLCPRSPGRPAEPLAAPDATASTLARPHPQPAPRSLHQLPEPGQLHSKEQPQPGPYGPLALRRAPSQQRTGAGPRPGQLAAQQQHPPGDQVWWWGGWRWGAEAQGWQVARGQPG